MRVLRLSPAVDWRGAEPAAEPDDADSVGGLAAQVLAQAEATARLGVEQAVLSVPAAGGVRYARTTGGARLCAAGRSGVAGVHRRNLWWLVAVTVRLARHGRRHDVVHVHASGILEPLLAVMAARVLARRPVVLTLHCSAQVTYVPHSRRDALVQVLTRAAERAAVRSAATTLVLTDRVKATLAGGGVEVAPDCLDVAAFADRVGATGAVRGSDGAPVALFVGRVSREKGWPALVELADRLRDRGLRVRICGDGPDLPALREAVAARGLEASFTFDGVVGHGQVADAMARADVLVLPSEHEELGSVLVEGMAAGLPAVASDVGGVGEAVVSGVTGLLVPPGDHAAFASAVERALDDDQLRARARDEGPAIALERFDVAVASGRLAALYARLAGPAPHPEASHGPLALSVLVDHYPALSETFVVNEIAALHRGGHRVHVETAAWAADRAELPEVVPTSCLDDDGLSARLAALGWLVAAHPAACARDLASRRRWRREERVRPLRVIAPLARRVARRGDRHLHAHFAAGVALEALRIGRMLGLPYSVTAHAYDIYRSPRNLAEKLERAAFATGECRASVSDLRALVSPAAAERIHVIAMGVDHERFRRSRPYPDDGSILAVGRLVPKKGFAHLIGALALVRAAGTPARLTIVGEGPLRGELEAMVRSLGLEGSVDLAGARTAVGVREALERADVLAISAVMTPDGDRDVLPLIAGEALAMEVPVVASDLGGLPEVVRPPWGRLVEAGEPAALAAALGELLTLDPVARAEAGRAGREFVVRTRDLTVEARRLVELISAGGRSPSPANR